MSKELVKVLIEAGWTEELAMKDVAACQGNSEKMTALRRFAKENGGGWETVPEPKARPVKPKSRREPRREFRQAPATGLNEPAGSNKEQAKSKEGKPKRTRSQRGAGGKSKRQQRVEKTPQKVVAAEPVVSEPVVSIPVAPGASHWENLSKKLVRSVRNRKPTEMEAAPIVEVVMPRETQAIPVRQWPRPQTPEAVNSTVERPAAEPAIDSVVEVARIEGSVEQAVQEAVVDAVVEEAVVERVEEAVVEEVVEEPAVLEEPGVMVEEDSAVVEVEEPVLVEAVEESSPCAPAEQHQMPVSMEHPGLQYQEMGGPPMSDVTLPPEYAVYQRAAWYNMAAYYPSPAWYPPPPHHQHLHHPHQQQQQQQPQGPPIHHPHGAYPHHHAAPMYWHPGSAKKGEPPVMYCPPPYYHIAPPPAASE